MRLPDQVFVVTGGGGQIARPILHRLAEAGAKLAVVDHALDRARAAAEAVGGLALACDLATPDGAAEMARAVEAKLGPIHGLVHTVGGFAWGPLAEAPPELYDRMFDRNVRSLFYALHAVVPGMRARGRGFLCGFSSLSGHRGEGPNTALYAASKSAVATLLRSLDGELAGSDVRVAIVYPMGAVDTAQNRRDMPETDPRTFIDPDEIAQAIVFAASRSPRGRLLELPIFPPR